MFRNFHYVYTLYEEGSFTKAASKLFISQPSLSTAIKKTEKDVGAPLFERRGNGVRLTDVGQAYIIAAEKIIRAENQFKQEVTDIQNLEAGQIVLGGSSFISSYVLPKIITRFTALHPKIKISLIEANSCKLLEMLDSEQVDIIIDNIESSDKYVGIPLLKEELLLCVSKEHPINQGLEKHQITPKQIFDRQIDIASIEPISLKRFENEKFILLKPGNDMHRMAMELFEKYNIEPDVSFSVDQLIMSYALTDSNMGVSFISDTFFKYGKFRDSVVLYKIDTHTRTFCCSHLRNKYCSKAMNEFIRVTKEVIK